MSTLITICSYSSTDPKSMLLKARLESEGIPCFIKNEFASFRRGGGKTELQIASADYELAIPILKEIGLYREEKVEMSPFFKKFDNMTKGIPVLKSLSMEMRLMLLVVLLVSGISTLFYYYLHGSSSNYHHGF